MKPLALHLTLITSAILLTACTSGGSGGGDGTDPQIDTNPVTNPDPSPDNRLMATATTNDYHTGSVITGATVTATWDEAGETGSFTAETDASGQATLLYPPSVTSASVSSDAVGYAEFGRTFALNGDTLSLQLIPVHASVEFNSAAEADLYVDDDSLISLPANAFVDAAGNAFSGDITAELTVIDPRTDPELMPGQYEAIDGTTGDISNIESFGAINATFQAPDGSPLQLAAGQSATVRIPLAGDPLTAPATIPLFYYDDASGYWVEEGSATLTQIDSEWFYVGTVTHFTTWNADQVYNTVFVNGCVELADGTAAANTRVRSTGENYTGTSTVTTDSSGLFSIPVRINSDLRIQAIGQGLLSGSLDYSSGVEDETLESCLVLAPVDISISLTWNADPDDLDTHLEGPDETGNFHLYYSNSNLTVGDASIFIDVDDTDGFGPEVTYLSNFPYDGTYSYSVYKYGGDGDIQASPARVELKIGDDRTVFTPPAGDPTECWQVFDIFVNGGVADVQTVGNWASRDDCYGSSETDEGDGGGDDVPVAVSADELPSAVSRKYYAR